MSSFEDATSQCVLAGVGAFAGWAPRHDRPECLSLVVLPLTSKDEVTAATPTAGMSMLFLHELADHPSASSSRDDADDAVVCVAHVVHAALHADFAKARVQVFERAVSNQRLPADSATASSTVPVGLAMCTRALDGLPLQWLSAAGAPDELRHLLLQFGVAVDSSVMASLRAPVAAAAAAVSALSSPTPPVSSVGAAVGVLAAAAAAATGLHHAGAGPAGFAGTGTSRAVQPDLDQAFTYFTNEKAPPLASAPSARSLPVVTTSRRRGAASSSDSTSTSSGADVLSYVEATDADKRHDWCFVPSTVLVSLPAVWSGSSSHNFRSADVAARRIPMALRDLRTLPPARALALLHNLLMRPEVSSSLRSGDSRLHGTIMQAVCTLFGAAVDRERGAGWVFDGGDWRAGAPDAFVPLVRATLASCAGPAGLRCVEPTFLCTTHAAVWWWLLWRCVETVSSHAAPALLFNVCALCELAARQPALGVLPLWCALGAVLVGAFGDGVLGSPTSPLPPAAPYVPWMRGLKAGTPSMTAYVHAMAAGWPGMMARRRASTLARVAASNRNTLQATLASRCQLCASTVFSFQTGVF